MPKTTKAIKSSDKEKAWNRKSTPTYYKLSSIPKNKLILIVCEGQTEKLYFESFPVIGINVEAIDLGGQAKLKLIESTIDIVKKSEKKYDVIWCVFDMDVKKKSSEFADFDNSIVKATKHGYNVAYSNDAFELWYYLHFRYSDSKNLRGFYYDELSNIFNIDYVSEGKKYNFCSKIYTKLLLSQERAITNAKKLFESSEHLIYHEQNPVTKVYLLVEELNKNLRK
jgi:RloB-like protein